ERALAPLEERLGQAPGRHRPERVAVATRVLGGDETFFARDPQRDRPALGQQRLRQSRLVPPGPEIASEPQQIVQLVRVPRIAAQLLLDLLERARVDQLPQLLLAEQLLQQLPVERERLGTPL